MLLPLNLKPKGGSILSLHLVFIEKCHFQIHLIELQILFYKYSENEPNWGKVWKRFLIVYNILLVYPFATIRASYFGQSVLRLVSKPHLLPIGLYLEGRSIIPKHDSFPLTLFHLSLQLSTHEYLDEDERPMKERWFVILKWSTHKRIPISLRRTMCNFPHILLDIHDCIY